MNQNENTADALDMQSTVNTNYPTTNLAGLKKNDKSTFLTMESKVATLALKFYDEQLPLGWDNLQAVIQSIDKAEYQILAIEHYKDYLHDDIWLPSTEKPHYHVILRTTDSTKSVRVKQLLQMLNIVYRQGTDDRLWREHGAETCVRFDAYATYLTHDTKRARLDGKAQYDITEIVSNLDEDEIKLVRDGYIRVSQQHHKVTLDEMILIDKEAEELGYNLKDFNDWYGTLPFVFRKKSDMKTVRESYERGIHKRVNENTKINRLCIFIQGAPNQGKTFGAIKALAGKKVLPVGGGGTGKFDRLSPSHEAIVIDDDVAPNLLNMTDNYICQAYKRQSSNPYWCGKYFVVTSNKTFKDWLDSCGIKSKIHIDAMLSRFYVCHIENLHGNNRLVCDSVSTRGTAEEQEERKDMFLKFQKLMNESLKAYVPTSVSIDYSSVMPEQYLKEIEEYEKALEKAMSEDTFVYNLFSTIDDLTANELRDLYYQSVNLLSYDENIYVWNCLKEKELAEEAMNNSQQTIGV